MLALLVQVEALADQPPYVVALLVMGVLLVTASMFIGLRNRKKRGAQHVTAREQVERAKQREGLKRDIEALAVEIEEMARRIGAQLDNKAARLETLLDQADAAADRLEHARLAMLNPATSRMPTSPINADQSDPSATSGVKSPGHPAGSGDRLTADVLQLHGQGMSAAEIARAVGEDAGKIELILALQNARS
ncbi:MAG: hypothetical protein AAF328_09190 [Planctomycetota bacterium]